MLFRRDKSVCEDVLEAVGWTPLIRLSRIANGVKTRILGKAEYLNPCSSLKDRIGITMIEDAEKKGILKPGGTLVEATSGNTGAALAMVAARKGYRAIFTMPDKMSTEKINLLKAFGADVIITPTAVPPDSPENYLNVAKKIAEETPNSFYVNQFYNMTNPETHYRSTGPEIWEQAGGKVDYFVAGMGTGGTISGTGKYLKEQNPKVRIVGADPVGSIIKDFFHTGEMTEGRVYKVEGIGEDMIPGALDMNILDDVRSVTDKQSFNMARRLAREEGIFVGGSSGTAVHVAVEIAREIDDENVTIVCMLADTGDRYMSKFHSDEWMRENRFLEVEKVNVGVLVDLKREEMEAIISVEPHATVRETLALMNDRNVSQLPVMENGESVGSVQEGSLMNKVLSDTSILDREIREVMEKPFPIVEYHENLRSIAKSFTRKNPAVLVREAGRIVGILTKFDFIHFLSEG
jgi:cystathionine beta-synthase